MMVGSTATLVGITKEMAIWDTPFLFISGAEADQVLDGKTGTLIKDKLQEKGLVGLVYWENGFRNLTISPRSERRRVGHEGVRTCRSRGSPYPSKTKTNTKVRKTKET